MTVRYLNTWCVMPSITLNSYVQVKHTLQNITFISKVLKVQPPEPKYLIKSPTLGLLWFNTCEVLRVYEDYEVLKMLVTGELSTLITDLEWEL